MQQRNTVFESAFFNNSLIEDGPFGTVDNLIQGIRDRQKNKNQKLEAIFLAG